MFNKITLALFGLSAGGMAVAGSMGPVCTPGNVTVPCEARQWDFGVQALYLRTVFGTDKSYQHDVVPFDGYTNTNKDWDWGFQLEGSYHFNTGNDVTMTWTHFQNDNRHADLAGFIPFSPLAQPLFTTYYLNANNQFDQVNLVMGQHADFGLVKNMRFYGGLQYASIDANAYSYFNRSPVQLVPSGILAVSQYERTDFKGVGPVIGIDYSYDLTEAFSLTANSSGSLLYGTSRFSGGYVGAPVNVVFASRSGSRKAVVPSVEAKLGVNYAYAMAQGVLNIEGGYQALNYFDPLQTLGVQGFSATGVVSTDYGLYGPYIGLKYVGNA